MSSQLKRRIQQDPRSLGNLAALANLNYAQLSTLMRDQIGVGPIVRTNRRKVWTRWERVTIRRPDLRQCRWRADLASIGESLVDDNVRAGEDR